MQLSIDEMEQNPALNAISKEIDDWEEFIKSRKPSSDTERDDPSNYKPPDTLHKLLKEEMEAGIIPKVDPALQKYLDELEKSGVKEININNKYTLCIETVYVKEDKDGNVIEIIEPKDYAPADKNASDTENKDSSPPETSNDNEKTTQDCEMTDGLGTCPTHDEPLNLDITESAEIYPKDQTGIQDENKVSNDNHINNLSKESNNEMGSTTAQDGNSSGNYEDLGATGYSFTDRQRKGAVLDPDVDLELGEFLSDDEDLQVEMLMDMMGSQETTEEYLSIKNIEEPKKGERYIIFNFENIVSYTG